jgi:hypothetical protein
MFFSQPSGYGAYISVYGILLLTGYWYTAFIVVCISLVLNFSNQIQQSQHITVPSDIKTIAKSLKSLHIV